ncbi:DNA cytosine methyltransferase [uncultured Brevundimonas sp.]|uniref:DNA cytosine methyltransferase n=1 Tax=uncultured Brevundimonas sp. TaxID=213418 RepID=UPI0025E010D7|nr:DNA cytosine methyltransferase [uncultured Brevundimonas sp.]
MRAIDLYSGVGGWSLGLALSGIEVVASYERFEPANETNRKNNRHHAIKEDIRTMRLEDLPTGIDLVVGSPPCTQFSYANRGGGGDIADGLKDIYRFFEIVEHIRPKHWVMENVPRVADVLRRELRAGGQLAKFADLAPSIHVVNMEEWGLPQRRKRCLAGDFDFTLLEKYRENLPRRTLGETVSALSGETVSDPVYGIELARRLLVDHVVEPVLDAEEERVNRAAKTTHTVYNAMPFPDPLDRSVRTITATCTRVSRESVVIAAPEADGAYRRLTLRERASLQGFPITFQFFGSSHGRKATMIGNAVPPLFAYYVGNACLGTKPAALPEPGEAISRFSPPNARPPVTKVDLAGKRYPADRTFRFSVPALNFKSGVRFELSNKRAGTCPDWHVAFYFGHSKDIKILSLGEGCLKAVMSTLPPTILSQLANPIEELRRAVQKADVKRMQDVWTRARPGGTRPFDLLDQLGGYADLIAQELEGLTEDQSTLALAHLLRFEAGDNASSLPGLPKLQRLARRVLAGAIMGGVVNHELSLSHPRQCVVDAPRAVAG